MKRGMLSLLMALALAACTARPEATARPVGTAAPPSAQPSPQPAVTPLPALTASPPATIETASAAAAATQSATPAAAATPQPTPSAAAIDEMAAMLPDREGYRWRYSGFADYSAELTLRTIANAGDARVYTAEGSVDDMSGGESGADYSLRAVYTVSPGSLKQELKGAMAMDRALPSLELLRAPLRPGTKWRQSVPDSTGRVANLKCMITDVRQVDGRKTVFARYEADGSAYYEKREFTEGMGVTAYDKLFMHDAGREEIGYRLVSDEPRADMSGWDGWLPRLDYEYTYFGLAEYGHKGSLSRVAMDDTQFVYDFNGVYDDATGDTSRFTVRYYVDMLRGTVTEQVAANERGMPEVNSKLHNLVILKFPLGLRARWSHQATLDGQSVTVRAEVIEYDDVAGLVKVKYTAKDAPGYYANTYIEFRTFERGYGMTGFGNLLPGDIGITQAEAQYAEKLQDALNQHMFGYTMNKAMVR